MLLVFCIHYFDILNNKHIYFQNLKIKYLTPLLLSCVLFKLSTRAMQGAAAEKELRKGNAIPNELLVDIIVEAIR